MAKMASSGANSPKPLVQARVQRVSAGSTVGLKETHTEELVFALCGPIGSPLRDVATTLASLLNERFGYDVQQVRLSAVIERLAGRAVATPRFDRLRELIKKGNELRAKHGSSVLADVAISEIAVKRERARIAEGQERFMPRRVCHIIDSIKNEAELEALRLVYRDMLHCIGVFSPVPDRVRRLLDEGMKQPQVHELIDIDSGEEFDHGQTVRATFPKSDYFLRAPEKSAKTIENRLLRYLDMVFSTSVVTPTAEETAMYKAASAARGSACLSRQVGAAIVDSYGQLLSIGWNDVPRFGGGLYTTSLASDGVAEAGDNRCVNWGRKCYNDEEKRFIAEQTADALVKEGLVDESERKKAVDVALKSDVGRLLEFSRAIHAEMHAVITASQTAGTRVKGSTLYCTTYPCHYCARHIVAAGVNAVYYIEPYRKSLATKLHDDAISEDEAETRKMRILPYDGIAPRKYLELFGMREDERKKEGVLITRNYREARPKSGVTLESLPALEGLVVNRLKEHKVLDTEPGAAP